MSGRIPFPDFVEEATFLVSEAAHRGAQLNILGATAIYVHCPKFRFLFESFGRKLSDIDFVSYSRFSARIEALLLDMGYAGRERFNAIHGKSRLIFDDSANKRYVDVFFDKLDMSHTVSFSGRLELEHPTITLADLLLEKMQIAQLNEKDIQDTIVLLREHDVDDDEKECVDGGYVAKQLAGDWGFWFTVTANLDKIGQSAKERQILSDEDKQDILGKLQTLRQQIDSEPKSMKWNMRARIGPKVKWYQDVDEARQ